tara:strand:+ start:207820 stop:208176 length:357 start_codon:yes stop_codon:yes gene_type:complete
MKNTIKRLVRESLFGERTKPNTKKTDKEDYQKHQGNTEKHQANTKKDYTDVQHALDKNKNLTAPTQVGIMKAMGIEDDKDGVNRSLFGKKLHQEKNDEGGRYQFDDDELGTIRGLLPK